MDTGAGSGVRDLSRSFSKKANVSGVFGRGLSRTDVLPRSSNGDDSGVPNPFELELEVEVRLRTGDA